MNYSRRDQIDIIKSIRLKDGESRTIDCPFCGGKKKFSITKNDGRVLWNCYKASCTSRGTYSSSRSIDTCKTKLVKSTITTERRYNPLPSVLSSPDNHEHVVEYLKSVNSYDAYKAGYIHIMYAPADNRVLFFTRNKSGAVGRALDGRLPKWWSYGDTEQGIQVGTGTHVVVVEDAASACSVSRLDGVTGYALLGTRVTTSVKDVLRHFANATIVLDKDASNKAIIIAKRLNTFLPTRVRLTKEDLKWLSADELTSVIGGFNNESTGHNSSRL